MLLYNFIKGALHMQNTPQAMEHVAPLLSIGEMITDALRREIAAQIAVA